MRRPDANRLADLAAACAAVPIVLITAARAAFLWGSGWEGIAGGFILLALVGVACLVPLALGIAAAIGGTEKRVRALLAASLPTLIVSLGWLCG
jgi:hypothetical protein